MNRMTKIFNKMMENGEKILVSYFPLCDTAMEDQVAWAGKFFENGTTVLEMGLPYKDPCLDGQIVRDSMNRALKRHTIEDAFATIRLLRERYPNNILQIMTYYEIIDELGVEAFAARCSEVGADAVLSPNATPQQLCRLDKELLKYDIINLRFAPFHLTAEVIADLQQHAKGYIFLQAVDGATGPQKTTSPQIGTNVSQLKAEGITTPVVAGFGISHPQHVKEIKNMGADGVIVGSSILRAVLEGDGEQFIKELREALE